MRGSDKGTYSLGEDLGIVALDDLLDLLVRSLWIDDLVLPLDPRPDFRSEIPLNDLMLLQQRREAGLDSLHLVLHRLVTLGHLEQAFDLVFALFTCDRCQSAE